MRAAPARVLPSSSAAAPSEAPSSEPPPPTPRVILIVLKPHSEAATTPRQHENAACTKVLKDDDDGLRKELVNKWLPDLIEKYCPGAAPAATPQFGLLQEELDKNQGSDETPEAFERRKRGVVLTMGPVDKKGRPLPSPEPALGLAVRLPLGALDEQQEIKFLEDLKKFAMSFLHQVVTEGGVRWGLRSRVADALPPRPPPPPKKSKSKKGKKGGSKEVVAADPMAGVGDLLGGGDPLGAAPAPEAAEGGKKKKKGEVSLTWDSIAPPELDTWPWPVGSWTAEQRRIEAEEEAASPKKKSNWGASKKASKAGKSKKGGVGLRAALNFMTVARADPRPDFSPRGNTGEKEYANGPTGKIIALRDLADEVLRESSLVAKIDELYNLSTQVRRNNFEKAVQGLDREAILAPVRQLVFADQDVGKALNGFDKQFIKKVCGVRTILAVPSELKAQEDAAAAAARGAKKKK